MLFGSSLDDAFTNRYPTIEKFDNYSNPDPDPISNNNSNNNSQDMYKLINDTFPSQENNNHDESYASFNSDSSKVEAPQVEAPQVESKVEAPKVNKEVNKLNRKIEQLEESINVINKKLNKLFDYVEKNNKVNFMGKNIHDILLFIIFGIFVILLIEVMFNVFKMKLNKL